MDSPAEVQQVEPETLSKSTEESAEKETATPCACYEKLHAPNNNNSESRDRTALGCDQPECPYRYLQQDSFTSEAYKIQLRNVHHCIGFKQMKKLLDSLNVKYRKVKLVPDASFVTFCSEEDRDASIDILNGYMFRGKKLEAKIALGRADPLLRKRQSDAGERPKNRKQQKLSPSETDSTTDPVERLRDTITPLWRSPYDPEQLSLKRSHVVDILARLRRDLIACNGRLELPKENLEKNATSQLCVCPIMEIIKSPVTTGYRNKAELTIGFDLDGNGPLVGFRFSKYRDGLIAVGSYRHASILSSGTMALLNRFDEFLQSRSKSIGDDDDATTTSTVTPVLTTFDPITHQGHWRQLMVRESRRGDRLLLVDVHPQQLSESDIQLLSNQLREWFTQPHESNGQSTGNGVMETEPVVEGQLTSLYLTTRLRASEPFQESNTRLLWGVDHIVELCCGLQFRVSLTAFFQINTLASELLYAEVAKFASGDYDQKNASDDTVAPRAEQTILFDMCCGTGTIGLCLAKHFDRVIGIELVPSAVEDAKQNAIQNGITNVEFHAGRVEHVLKDLLKSLPDSADVVAVLDPPRSGVHINVIQALRRCTRLRRIVYVSCSLEAAMSNFVDFARPISNRYQGDPFIPVMALPVDLFPQTKLVEIKVEICFKKLRKSSTE